MSNIHPRRQKELEKLIQKLGLPDRTAVNWELLDLALTHPTASAGANYEQLEFIGDAVVRLAAAEFLWQAYPDSAVGEFAAIRSVLVSDRILAQIAQSYGFDRYLIVSNSAAGDKAGSQSRLADALEAVLAALYLTTQTLELVRPWLDSHFQTFTEQIRRDPARQNYKAALQEWTQAQYKILPEYRVRETNPIHGDIARFSAEVWLLDRCLGRGTGPSIKAAEQAAARDAFLAVTGEP
jgi:ribonuclease III